ncbi:MAG: hypothetical protein J2P21_10495 [Chloracidobacterium sp.]|nr:hypothetical protein [Chloracidobacterium sp.]
MSEGRGSRVMWLMILIGVGLAAGFVFALRSQINAYRIGRAEEQLRMKLDEYSGQQKFRALDLAGALSADESDRAARLNGLDNLRLERVNQVRPETPKSETPRGGKLIYIPPVKAPKANQNDRLGDGGNGGRSSNRPVERSLRSNSQPNLGKVGNAVKTGKTAKLVKVVKLKSGPRESSANKAKANVTKTKQRQQR